jgi:hypothetical protein
MTGRRFLLVDTTLARPGVRCRLADFSAAAMAARSSQHCLDDFKIKKGLNPCRGQNEVSEQMAVRRAGEVRAREKLKR